MSAWRGASTLYDAGAREYFEIDERELVRRSAAWLVFEWRGVSRRRQTSNARRPGAHSPRPEKALPIVPVVGSPV